MGVHNETRESGSGRNLFSKPSLWPTFSLRPVFLLLSKKDPRKRQYAGQTGAEIGTRTNQHGGDIDSEADKPVPNHFKLTGSTRSDLRVTPFMRVKNNNPWVRLHLEVTP